MSLEGENITLDNLVKSYRGIDESFKNDQTATFYMAASVVQHFFGKEWVTQHCRESKDQYFSFYNSVGHHNPTGQFRTIYLGELLFNLQYTSGFQVFIKEYKNQKRVESLVSELNAVMIMYINDWDVKFNKRTGRKGRKGRDYDIVVNNLNGFKKVAIEVKSKLESDKFDENNLKNTLSNAVKQLPNDIPSIIFCKVPCNWLETDLVKNCTENWFSNNNKHNKNKKIVSVIFYAEPCESEGKEIRQGFFIHEINNPINKFNWNIDLELLKFCCNTNPNPLPSKWIRLYYINNDGYNPPNNIR